MSKVQLPETIYARVVDPGTPDEYLLTGTDPSEVDDTSVGENQSVSTNVGRYRLVGEGSIRHTAPVYMEDNE